MCNLTCCTWWLGTYRISYWLTNVFVAPVSNSPETSRSSNDITKYYKFPLALCSTLITSDGCSLSFLPEWHPYRQRYLSWCPGD